MFLLGINYGLIPLVETGESDGMVYIIQYGNNKNVQWIHLKYNMVTQ